MGLKIVLGLILTVGTVLICYWECQSITGNNYLVSAITATVSLFIGLWNLFSYHIKKAIVIPVDVVIFPDQGNIEITLFNRGNIPAFVKVLRILHGSPSKKIKQKLTKIKKVSSTFMNCEISNNPNWYSIEPSRITSIKLNVICDFKPDESIFFEIATTNRRTNSYFVYNPEGGHHA